jgi:hypothetical protein
LSLRSDDLDSIGEPYTEDELGQVVVTIKAAIQFVRGKATDLGVDPERMFDGAPRCKKSEGTSSESG